MSLAPGTRLGVSALNHPHIRTVHDIGKQDDTDFLVMVKQRAGQAAWEAVAEAKNDSTSLRNESTVAKEEIFCRKCLPFGRPCVYQPVKVLILWSAKRSSSPSRNMRKWLRIISRRSSRVTRGD